MCELIRAVQLWAGLLTEHQEIPRMTLARRSRVARIARDKQELADRLQHRVAREAVWRDVGTKEAVPDQFGDTRQRVRGGRGSGDLLRCLERAPAGERGELPEM